MFSLAEGSALLGLLGDSALAMHGRAGRHAPIIPPPPPGQDNTLILLHPNQHNMQNILASPRDTKIPRLESSACLREKQTLFTAIYGDFLCKYLIFNTY